MQSPVLWVGIVVGGLLALIVIVLLGFYMAGGFS
jgi:uncharacterized protein YneF (UPF0154 family)